MKNILSYLLLFGLVSPAYSITYKYPCDSISPAMRMNANAVVRSEQQKVTFHSEKEALVDCRIAITLLNEQAEDFLLVEIPYDKMMKVRYITGSVYNGAGKLVWTLKPYDVRDNRYYSGPAMLSDRRKKVFEFPTYNYPFTVEYSYGYDAEVFAVPQVNYLQYGESTSVETSGIQYIIPRNFHFNYRSLNLKNPTDSNVTRKNLTLSWQEENIPAKKSRNYAPPLMKSMPVVYTAQAEFSVKGYKGSFASWKSYGDFIQKLIEGRDQLEPQYVEKALALVRNASSNREKVRILYEYLQKSCHYFFVGFGIGGNQPMTANEVARNGYGDCKALSNYMKAMLKAVGIESWYTLVKSGKNEYIEPLFPSDQFDHIILCVPDKKDTIWLECTSQTLPFDFLGYFTCSRDVLSITPEGGKLLRTPDYGKNVNAIGTISKIKLYGSGDADIQIDLKKTGLLYEELEDIAEGKADERKQWLADQLGNAGFELLNEDFSYAKKTLVPECHASFKIRLHDLAAKSADRIFLDPVLLNRNSYLPEDPTDLEINKSYTQNDTVRIEIPIGYQLEFLPAYGKLTSKFGSYACHIRADNKYIYFVRSLEINEASSPREAYGEFYSFLNDIAENDEKMIVLKATK
jgi:transglutaminase-like putative cysteine protease